MLHLSTGPVSLCDRLDRRGFLIIGGAGIAGLSLPQLLRAEAGLAASGKSVINIWLAGGPSHLDMFDMKPEAPREIRGEFQPIPTSVPGLDICEMLPQLAQRAELFSVIRSITGLKNEHAPSQSNSGWSTTDMIKQGGRPGIGPVLSRLRRDSSSLRTDSAPTAVDLTGWTTSGFLGPMHAPFRPDDAGRANLTLGRLSADRLLERQGLASEFDRLRERIDRNEMMDAMDSFSQRATGMVLSGDVARALDLSNESPETLDRYHARQDSQARNFLLARRLIEAGVRSVAFSYLTWDTHVQGFQQLRSKIPALDPPLSALLDDLQASGRLAETIVMMSGEFGRTPRINATAGRDHWPQASFFFLAGGGLRSGQVIGSTGRLGERPDERPIHIQEVFATVYRQLGVDVRNTTITDHNGRPQYLVDQRTVIPELL